MLFRVGRAVSRISGAGARGAETGVLAYYLECANRRGYTGTRRVPARGRSLTAGIGPGKVACPILDDRPRPGLAER